MDVTLGGEETFSVINSQETDSSIKVVYKNYRINPIDFLLKCVKHHINIMFFRKGSLRMYNIYLVKNLWLKNLRELTEVSYN